MENTQKTKGKDLKGSSDLSTEDTKRYSNISEVEEAIENSKEGTIGEKIDQEVKEYLKLYKSFRKDSQLKERANGLTMNDLHIKKFIAGQVFERVENAIKRFEGAE